MPIWHSLALVFRSYIIAYTNMKVAVTNRVDLMFRAFSDRNRLRILHLLQGGEMCVGDIVDILQVPQPRVSRHLAYLPSRGLRGPARTACGATTRWRPCERLPKELAPLRGHLLLRRAGDSRRRRPGDESSKRWRLLRAVVFFHFYIRLCE